MNEIIDSDEINIELTNQEKTWGMLCHLLALSGLIIPFGGIIGPLVMWLVKKDESKFVDIEGKESLNFQITMFLIYIVCGFLTLIFIGVFLLVIAFILQLVFVIMGTIKANNGEHYKYPFNFRFIK